MIATLETERRLAGLDRRIRRKNMNAEITTNPLGVFKDAAGISIGWAVVMILLGFLAVLLPLAAGLGVSIVVSWIIAVGGVAYLFYAFAARGAGAFLWRALIGIVYLLGGGYLAFHPAFALESLTLVVAAIFFLEGVMELIAFIQHRAVGGSGWVLFDAIVTLFLSFLIWRTWPFSSPWAIGTLVGINLIFRGVTWLMYSSAARRTLNVVV
jgi:uncharacterized membrane protein HdeD (DUF308 family)